MWTVLLVALLLLGEHAVKAIKSIPACRGQTCQLATPSVPSEFLADMTACGTEETCPTCLVGDEWSSLLSEIGVGKAQRTWKPVVGVNSWVSGEMVETIFQILAREAMGYDVQNTPVDVNGVDVLCCDETLIALEDWPNVWSTTDEGLALLQSSPIGYEGGSGLYIPSYTVQRYPLATSWAAYKYLDAYKTIFPLPNATNCTLALRDVSLPCADGNYWCNDETWATVNCTGPRYVPPQCVNNPNCRDIFLSDPVWDVGFFEALIKNTGLNFTLVYLNTGRVTLVEDMAVRREDVMFWHWEPDPLIARVDARSVAFDPPTLECKKKQNPDPGVSLGDCDYPRSALQKLARKADLQRDHDFKYFFEAFYISSSMMRTMLARHDQGGGNETLYDVSCNWVKENYATWKEWVRNTPSVASSSSNSGALAIAIAVPVGALIAVCVILYVVMLVRANAAVKYAPKKAPLTLIFTDVESSTTLWERYGNEMAKAMEIHHAIVRDQIAKHECYEVKTIGDSFMIACPTVVDATLLSLDIQTSLHEAAWPDMLKYWKDGDDGSGMSWKGLRVRIGVHLCNEVEPKFDMIHRGYDYYGHDVNVSARIESVAAGGQILMDADTYTVLLNDPDYADVVQGDMIAIKFASRVELKGVADTVTVFSILPKSLGGRSFPPIPNAVDETAMPAANNESSSINAPDTETLSTCSSSQVAGSTIRYFFAALPSRDREALLDSWLAVNGIPTKGTYERKMKRLAAILSKHADESHTTTVEVIPRHSNHDLHPRRSMINKVPDVPHAAGDFPAAGDHS